LLATALGLFVCVVVNLVLDFVYRVELQDAAQTSSSLVQCSKQCVLLAKRVSLAQCSVQCLLLAFGPVFEV
jgi:hypothetical protein